MTIIPRTRHFGEIKLVKMLAFFNEPLLFQGSSDNSPDLFGVLVSTDNGINKWSIVDTSQNRKETLLSGSIDFYTAFKEPENKEVVIVEVSQENGSIITEKNLLAKYLPDSFFPERGLYFNGESLVEKDYAIESNSRNRLRIYLHFINIPPGFAPIGEVGDILVAIEQLLSAISQFVFGEAKEKGKVKAELKQLASMNLAGLSSGSTIVELVSADEQSLFGENAKIIEKFIELIDSSGDEEKLTYSLQEMKRRVSSSYRDFLLALKNQPSEVLIESIKAGSLISQTASLPKDDIDKAIVVIEQIETSEPENLEITGLLMGLNLHKKTFDLHQHIDEGVQDISGDIDDSIVEGLRGTKIGLLYKFSLRRTEKIKKYVGGTEEVYLLNKLESLNDAIEDMDFTTS